MKRLFFMLLLVSASTITSQNYWKELSVSKSKPTEMLSKIDTPSKFQLFTLNKDSFISELASKSENASNNIITLPSNEGFSKFRVTKKQIFENELAIKFPQIKSYTAKGIDDPTAIADISIGTNGVFVMIRSNHHNTLYIDPYSKDRKTYMLYKNADLSQLGKDFLCKLEENEELNKTQKDKKKTNRGPNDMRLRTYRIAIVCTSEYSQFQLNDQNVSPFAPESTKKAAVLSVVNTTLTRINSIFERDLAVRLVLVGNNDRIVFLNASNDNLTNNNIGALVNEGQSVCDSRIGSNNYDLGHVFSQNPFLVGAAVFRVVCANNYKARAASSYTNPTGNSYFVNVVAHEIGHQFGAEHTFNNPCGGNRSQTRTFEPGSGSTIMSYGGGCPPNVTGGSDEYFHGVNITEMWSFISGNANCAGIIQNNNQQPWVSAGPDRSIPKSTPFVLRGGAADTEAIEKLTFCWEQLDTEISTMPPVSTSTGGPLFRSLPPKNSPNRYMPDFSTVLAGNLSSTWEVLPSVARELNFALTVRDNHPNGGAVNRDDIRIQVTNAPPFTIQNLETWQKSTNQTLTWNVGQTNQAPINCQKVNIKLSTNGGISFDHTLASNTDNDGSESLFLSNLVEETENAIIMVEAADNIFYNITAKFTITPPPPPNFTIENTSGDGFVCKNTTDEHTFNITFIALNEFEENAVFSLNNIPEGAISDITPDSLSDNGTFTVTFYNLTSVTSGTYEIILDAKIGNITESLVLNLDIASEVCHSEGNTLSNISTTLVQFNTIDNETQNKVSGYQDFREISTIVIPGETYPLHINTLEGNNSQSSSYTYAWIDWNQNCILEDTERFDFGSDTIVEGTDSPTILSPVDVTVPQNAVIGSTLLRISTKNSINGLPQPCEIDFDGEVEDYTIIVDATANITEETFENFTLNPNPSAGEFRLRFNAQKGDVMINLFDTSGRLVEFFNYKNNESLFSKSFSVETISSGLYIIHIKNEDIQITRKLVIKH